MQSYVNPPIAFPELDLGSGSYGLAHIALQSDVYRKRLKEIAKSDRYLILDNAADELVEGMQGNDFYDLITDIEPDEVISPDVLGDAVETRERFTKFWPWFEEWKTQTEGRVPKLMVVVQGKSYQQWLEEAVQYLHDPRVDVIGIPYDIKFDVPIQFPFPPTEFHESNYWGARRYALIEALNWELKSTPKPLHLLGMSNLYELTAYSQSPVGAFIRSNDTTAPFAAAADELVHEWDDARSGPKEWKSLDFYTEELDQDVTINNLIKYFDAVGDVDALKNLRALVSDG